MTSTTPIIVPSYKPSLLASLPLGVSLLTPTGPVPIQYTLDETGLSFLAGQVVTPVPVLLGTYFMNLTSEDACMLDAARNPTWPQVGNHVPASRGCA